MANKKTKGKSFDQLKEKYYGKKGTPKRDAFDKESAAEIAKEKKKQGFIQITSSPTYADFISQTFVMTKAVMPVPLKPNQEFEIFKVEVNKRIGNKHLEVVGNLKNGDVLHAILYTGGSSSSPNSNWSEFPPRRFINKGNLHFLFYGFKKGDKVTIHYNLTK